MHDTELRKTWIFDLDGTILVHGGVFVGNRWTDELLPHTLEVWRRIPPEDTIVLITARPEKLREATIDFLAFHDLRYDHLIFGVGAGPRILFNDTKPNGTVTAIGVPVERDIGVTTPMIENYL